MHLMYGAGSLSLITKSYNKYIWLQKELSHDYLYKLLWVFFISKQSWKHLIIERKCTNWKPCLKLIETLYRNYVMDIFPSKSVNASNYYILLCLYPTVFVSNRNTVTLTVFLLDNSKRNRMQYTPLLCTGRVYTYTKVHVKEW